MLLEVGTIIRPHGLRGELVVDLTTNRLERLAPGSVLSIRAPTAAVASPDDQLVVRSSRPHQSRYLVVFEGISTIDAAEALRGVVLLAEPITDPVALFVHDLIGKEVVDTTGARRGIVTSVEANPASDLLVLDNTWRVPAHFIVTNDDQITIDAPEGLFS